MGWVVRCPSQVTAEWIASTAKGCGAIGQGSVRTVEPVKTIQGRLSTITFFRIGWSPDTDGERPSQLCLKTSNPGVLPLTDREVVAYRDVFPKMRRGPFLRCFSAEYAPRTGGYHVLLEDVSPTHRNIVFGFPPTQEESVALVDALARFHAFWWDHPKLGTEIGKRASEYDIRRMVGYAAAYFPKLADLLGERLTADQRKLFERVFSGFVSAWKRRLAEAHLTLVHGDAHIRNFLVPRNGCGNGAYIIDWETPVWVWNISCGVSDLAYLIVRHWSPERRKVMEKAVLRQYFDRLQEEGVTGYSWDDLWNDYRLAATLSLCFIVHEAFTREPTVWYPQLENVVSAAERLACADMNMI